MNKKTLEEYQIKEIARTVFIDCATATEASKLIKYAYGGN